MRWSVIVVIAILLIIITIIIIIALAFTFNASSGPQGICQSQSDCQGGFVCDTSLSPSICKGGIETPCKVNNDCLGIYTCANGFCFPRPIPIGPTGPTGPTGNTGSTGNTSNINHCITSPFTKPPEIYYKLETITEKPIEQCKKSQPFIPYSPESGNEEHTPVSPEEVYTGPIDVHSFESENSPIDSPFVLEDKKYISHPVGESGAIDVCSFSSAIITLLCDGTIIRKTTKSKDKIQSNISLNSLQPFSGYLFSVSKGTLYQLLNDTYPSKRWIWNEVKWAPISITNTSVTLDGAYLLIQTTLGNYIYNTSAKKIDTIPIKPNIRRVYGKSLNNYLDIDTDNNKIIVIPPGQVTEGVYDGVITYYGEVIFLSITDKSKYRAIKLVEWMPYYLSY